MYCNHRIKYKKFSKNVPYGGVPVTAKDDIKRDEETILFFINPEILLISFVPDIFIISPVE